MIYLLIWITVYGIPNNMPKTIIVDADAIIATFFPNDANHKKAGDILEKLTETDLVFYYPASA